MLRTGPVVLPPDALPQEPLGPDEPDSLDTDAIIRFIRRRWRLCTIWILAGLGAGIAFALLSPAYYTAYATILFEDRALRPLAASIGGADAAASSYLDSQVQVLESDEVVGRVVAQNRLTDDQEFGKGAGGLRARIAAFLGLGRATRNTEPRHLAILRVRSALSVRRVGVSDVVEIGFTSHNPARAAAIANAAGQSYVDGRLELKRQAREDAASYVRERLAALRDKAFAIEPPQDSSPATPQSAEQARARFRELQNNAETYRALYNGLLQRAYADGDSPLSSLGLRVITPAEAPLGRSWPRSIHVIGILAVAAVAGIGHALLKEVTDHSLKTVDDVQRATSLDCIAGVPRIDGQAWTTEESRPADLQPAYLRASASLCEAMVRVALRLHEGQNRRSGLVIGVAAAAGGAGVSSIAAHLARIMAESGQKTLLVDANWRKPSMPMAMLNSSSSRTLARGLASIHLEPERLDVLVLRATAPISELNASLSIISTLQHLQTEYDCVVVDLHAAEQSADLEASISVVSEVIVVVEAGRTTSQSLHGLLRALPRDKIAAVVLNKI